MLIIHISSRFRRSFRQVPVRVQTDFETSIEKFQQEPFHPSLRTHKLSGGLANHYSFYLRDGYRVLFTFMQENVILLVNIGSHDEYKRWAQ
ncbi:MAG: type II toxin-antitoxin system mRNA interferase toxin, RelE/StbE family [Candidatus Uhrbacteria bacterium]|nr:type II toxin-antitoxin system mRNA interferase toxin, RelE/StbE family [Candidatus Uhrbacteria bacterium]